MFLLHFRNEVNNLYYYIPGMERIKKCFRQLNVFERALNIYVFLIQEQAVFAIIIIEYQSSSKVSTQRRN